MSILKKKIELKKHTHIVVEQNNSSFISLNRKGVKCKIRFKD